MKRIANIVFYKFNGERPNMKQACIFYTDGTVKNTSYEEGLEACQEIVERYNITSRETFKEMINNQVVYVMSGREFEERFQSFISREDVKTSTDLVPVQPQNTDLVSYQKVYKPTKNNAVKPEAANEKLPGFNNVEVPEKFNNDIEEEIKKHAKAEKPIVDFSDSDNGTETPDAKEKADVTPIIIPPVGRKTSTDSNSSTNKNNNGHVAPVVNPSDDKLDKDFVNGLDESAVISPISHEVSSSNNDPIEDDGLADEEEKDNNDKNNNVIHNNNNGRKTTPNPRPTVVVPPVGTGTTPVEKDEDCEDVEDYEDVEDFELDDNKVYYDDGDFDGDIEDDFEEELTEEEPKKENKFVAWIKRGIEKVKNMKLVKKITAVVLAILIGCGLYSCSARQTKSGEMHNSNLSTSQDVDVNELEKRGGHLFLIYGNNNHWNDYSYEELQKVTKEESQKEVMEAAATTLEGFNNVFANAHVEEGKDVKPALTFDEIIALQQAYNNYTPEQIKAIFNGANIKSQDMARAYRDANLQLMGAYVIQTRENPVDMSGIINSEEGKEFYQKYQNLFLDAKEATGEDKLKKIELFYQEVRKDFPITQDVRTEGIAHADDYATIESYKYSVTPIIAAAEIMFQNYEVDYTLKDGEIDFLNDLGLCNLADETFERIETITLTNPEDNKNPLYTQYRDAIIYMLKADGNYYVDDEHRELTKLDAFQQQVNWHAFEGRWVYSSYTYYTTETHTETKTWTETTTETRVEETREEKPITEEAKQEVDEQIEEENEQARQEAEEEAEQNRQEMQEEADREAERIEEEVEQDAADLEENIEDANEQIEENNRDQDSTNDTPVNEDDLGHGVEFDDDHQDGNGNLNDSVENITTDPHGDETGSDFPDPNETGREFDAAGESMDEQETATDSYYQDKYYTEDTTPKAAIGERGVTSRRLTNEQIVDLYIEQLANQSFNSEKGYQYKK